MKNYNIKLLLSFVKHQEDQDDQSGNEKGFEFVDLGILYDGGRKCVTKGLEIRFWKSTLWYLICTGPAGISGLEKITEEELEAIENDFDPIGRFNILISNL